MAIVLSEAWPINNAQNELQMLCGRCSLPTLHFLDNASAAKGVASVGRLVLHAPIRFLRPIDFPAVGKRNMHTIADRLRVFAFKGENVGQESLYTRIGHGRLRSPQSRIYPVALHHTHLSVAAFYATGLGTGGSIDNIQQSAICRGSEVVSHVRSPSSILPAGTGESGKMTFASEGFIHAPVGWTIITCSLALASTSAIAQAGATPPSASGEEAAQRIEGREQPASAPSVASELCPTLEQAAAENGLPLDFFVRVIWQESRFNALAISPKGAQGIAQFMPRTADWRGLSNPFDVNAALKASASYLRDLLTRFGNLGLAAAAYNAGPQRVQDWLSARGGLPKETRHYVQIVTGHSAEEWSGGTTQRERNAPRTGAVLGCSQVYQLSNGGEVRRWHGECAKRRCSPRQTRLGSSTCRQSLPKPLH